MEGPSAVRLDKWLWAVRIFKTRSAAAEACRGHKVAIEDQKPKPAHDVKPGQLIRVQKEAIQRQYKVLGLIEKRVGAQVAKTYVEEVTPPEELQKLQERRLNSELAAPKGWGRPTKKERRAMEQVLGLNREPSADPAD